MLGFAYRLALKLGVRDGRVWDWLEELPWHQFLEWIQFEEVDGPWGSRRDETVNAVAGVLITNELRELQYVVRCYMSTKEHPAKRPKLLEIGDLLPEYRARVTKKEIAASTARKSEDSDLLSDESARRKAYHDAWLLEHKNRRRELTGKRE